MDLLWRWPKESQDIIEEWASNHQTSNSDTKRFVTSEFEVWWLDAYSSIISSLRWPGPVGGEFSSQQPVNQIDLQTKGRRQEKKNTTEGGGANPSLLEKVHFDINFCLKKTLNASKRQGEGG